jgi:uncharacterized protein with HEPN domain
VTGDAVYLRHILDAIDTIEGYVSVGREDFLATSHWHDSTIRQLEVVGEATKRLSRSFALDTATCRGDGSPVYAMC